MSSNAFCKTRNTLRYGRIVVEIIINKILHMLLILNTCYSVIPFVSTVTDVPHSNISISV